MLDELVISSNVTLLYVGKISDNYTKLTYIFDSVHPDTGFDRYPLGYVARDLDPNYRSELKEIMTTGKRSSTYFYSNSDASGAHTTAGIAIKNSQGKIVGFLGVEKAMTVLNQARMTYVAHVIEATAVLFLILYGILARAINKMEVDIETYVENLTKITAEYGRKGTNRCRTQHRYADSDFYAAMYIPGFPGQGGI